MALSTSTRTSSKYKQIKPAVADQVIDASAAKKLKAQFELFRRIVLSAACLALAVFLLLALLTYNATDPSWTYVSSMQLKPTNLMGATGALFADVLLTFFGWAAYLIPLVLAHELISLWWSSGRLHPAYRYAAVVFCLLAFASLTALVFWQTDAVVDALDAAAQQDSIARGGILGFEIAAGLVVTVGKLAATVFAVGLALLTLTFGFDVRWSALVASFKHAFDGRVYLDELEHANEHKNSSAQTQSEPTDQAHYPRFDDLTMQPLKHSQSSNNLSTPMAGNPVRQTQVESLRQENMRKRSGSVAHVASTDFNLPTSELMHSEPANLQTDDNKHINPSLNASTIPKPTTPKHRVRIAERADASIQAQNAVPASQDAQVEANDKAWNNDTDVEDLLSVLNEDATESKAQQAFDKPNTTQTISALNQDVEQQSKQIHLPNQSDSMIVNTPAAKARVREEKEGVNQDFSNQDLLADELSGGAVQQPKAALSTDAQHQHHNTAHSTKPEQDLSLDTSKSRAFATAEHRATLSPLPSIDLLDKPDPNLQNSFSEEELVRLSELLEIKLAEFGVKSDVVEAQPGPVVTRFLVELAAGVKASKVTNISRDLARSLSMASVRVVEIIPGKPYIGIEVPNARREMVRLIEVVNTKAFTNPTAGLSMAIGKDIGGKPLVTDLAKAPHMLVAGTTGSGKSVTVNVMLLSMLLKYTPDDLRLILIDPKQLELANYSDIPHLLTPVVTDMKDAAAALNWCVQEMERRYKLMAFLKVRKLSDYNLKIKEAQKRGEDLLDPLWRANDSVSMDKPPRLKPLAKVVVIADEFADMIMQVGKQAEELITRLAQKSRAAGIHLVLATQRPSVDVITGLIKANIPTRMALHVNSKVDSRTILDQGGAEDMLGNGDMLFLGPGKIEPERAHSAFVSDDEVNTVCDAWRERGSPDYVEDMFSDFDESGFDSGGSSGGAVTGETDKFYDEAVAFVMETRKVSASSIQRKFSIGYNRAARIVDAMEESGLISSMDKSGKRKILV